MTAHRARRLGFDAVRAVRNGTGLGNYARSMLAGLRHADPTAAFHLYSPRPPAPAWRGFPDAIDATLHLPRGVWRAPGLAKLHRTFRLGRSARHDDIDLFHGLTHEMPRDLPATGIRSVVTFHDLLFLRAPELFRAHDRVSYRWRYEWSAHHADHVIAVSEQTATDLTEILGIVRERITVIPPAVDPAFVAPVPGATRDALFRIHGIPDEYLVSVGTLETRKNHRLLVEAMALLDPRATPPLVLVGRDGGAQSELRELARARGVETRLVFTGGVPPTDLPALVQGARALLYPSRAEGFGMPIAEGLAAGVPVIALDTPTSREAGGTAARLVRDAPDAVAEAIVDALEGRGVDVVLGRTVAARFDRDALAARTWSVYDALMAS